VSDPAVKVWFLSPSLYWWMEGTQVTAGPLTRVEHVYWERGATMWRAVYLFSGDRDIASDAVAEAFAQALRRGEEIRALEPWLWRTAFLIARGMLQDRRQERPDHSERSEDFPQGTLELLSAIRQLPPMQRAAVVLHYYADFPIRDVAALTGSTAAAVGVHLHRARRRLRALLEVHDG
jgi:RNA polymerase sigma factor (sigma-70 family)